MKFNLVKRVFLAFVLLTAGGLGHAGEIHELIISNAGTNALKLLEANPALIEDRDATNCTPLHYAAQFARTNIVRWLLKHKADVNAIAYDGFTPLYLTSDGGIARMLLSAGANPKLRDNWGRTPLQHAAQLGHTNVCEAILSSGFPLDLTSALFLGRRDDAKKIIRRKPAEVKDVPEDMDLWGNTSPLGIAAGNGDREIVELLLKAGAPVNALTARPGLAPMTPLCNAVWGGHLAVAELLCKAGANCNVTGGKFYPTLLDYAQEHSDPLMIELLIRYGGKSGK